MYLNSSPAFETYDAEAGLVFVSHDPGDREEL